MTSTNGVVDALPADRGTWPAPPDAELPERAHRRQFTAAYKLRILEEADACSAPGQVGALLRRQVEEAARAKWNQMLVVDVLHELRTPLTVILGYAQVRRRNPALPSSCCAPVALIEKSALQMRGTIDDLAQRWEPGSRERT